MVVALMVMLATSASAVAGSAAFTQAEPGDSPRIVIRTDGQKQMAALGSTRSLLDGAALMAGRAGRSGQAASVDIFYDGFEAWPGPWDFGYLTGKSTWTWGATPYRAAAGSRSAYCAGSDIQAPGPYANNMEAWLWTGPISLAGVTAATLEYKFYLNCESGFDGLVAYVSLNDADYYAVDSGYTGFWPWTRMEVDLTSVPGLGNVCGQSTVYVAFIFESDESGVGEGAYVDEVRITSGGAPPAPSITSLMPNHGATGTSVVIAGSNLGTSGAVRFGTTTASTSAWSATSITCTVPASLSPGSTNVTVTPAGGTGSNALPFTVDASAATISSLTPNHGATGLSVVIAGSNLGTTGAVRFGTTTASTSSWSATSLTCTVPASLAPGPVSVTVTPTGGTASNALTFTVDQAALKLASWTISGQPLVVPYNGTVAVSGTLRDKASGALLGGRAAELHYTYDPTDYDSWVSLGETYSATGQFTEGVAGLQRRTYFSWKFAGDAQYWWEWSGDLKIMARAKLAPPPIPKTVRRGTKVVAWGTLRPKHSAAANRVNHTKTQFQRFSNGKYRNVATLWARAYRNTASATQYKIVVSGFGKNGKWRVRAVHSDADHAKTTSAWRTFTVK